jgi:pimeloyl-ACP methyl ester carboxylesterase
MKPKRFFQLLGRTTALAAMTVVVYLLGCQSRMMYYPRAYEPGELADFKLRGGVVLGFETPQGRQQAFYRPGPTDAGSIWLWFPGNAALSLEYATDARDWDPDAGWLFVDYPGYGDNPGRPNPESVRHTIAGAAAALAAHLRITAQELAPRLGAAGQSLGAAAALIAAETLSIDRIVLLAPFTTMTEMGRLVIGWPLCHLNRHRYDNRRTLQAAVARGARVWIVHGVDDEIIPIEMARELAALAPAAVRLSEVAGGGHNDLPSVAPAVLARVFREAGGG